MEVYSIDNADDINYVLDVVEKTWGSLSPINRDLLVAMEFHGGIILMAEDGGKIVGIQVSVPGRRRGHSYLYSHVTGVIPEYRDLNVGSKLKLRQKDLAIQMGFNLIAWTFDPALAKNAYFNIVRLGTIARSYHINFYGSMVDHLNSGLPTDRLVAEWWIDRPREMPNNKRKIDMTSGEVPDPDALEPETTVTVSIPENFEKIKKDDMERALQIRLNIRKTLTELLKSGYIILDFKKETHSYVLVNNESIKHRYGEKIFD